MYYQQPETFQHVTFTNPGFPINQYNILQATTMPHWHNHYEVIMISKGCCQVHIDGSCFQCSSGDILFIPPNALHSIMPQDKSVYNAVVLGDHLIKELSQDMPIDTLSKGIHEFVSGPSLHLSPDMTSFIPIKESLLAINAMLTNKGPYYENIIISEILRLFSYAARHQKHTGTSLKPNNPILSAQTELVKDVINFLENNYASKITIGEISNRYGVSEQHFSRLFKAYTGKTFVEYLTLYRLEQANKLLTGTTLPITRIPELTGFCNPNYFSRIYRKHFGFPPSKARKYLKDI